MDDLIAFLRARLDEDEAIALKVKATWRLDGPDTGVIIASVGRNAEQCAEAYWVGVGEHIVRHDPARVLREVEAKRKIIDRASDWTSNEYEAWPVLCMLALAHADHPDYQPEEWKP